ncbi:hypothetical protein HDK77DRAFT_425565 [Phyllosticta capitalensis]
MPSILSDEDKQTVKRTVPKASNKIHAVAVAKLYIAYPNRQRWTYTGLQGAAVLANDLVGNTFWIKLVDISEIYDTFQYNQDRTFFHTFELEECMAALSFADEKEAKQFKKKMDEREKNAHKNTKNKPFALSAGSSMAPATNGKDHGGHGLLGSITGSLFGHKNSHQQQANHSIIPPKDMNIHSPTATSQSSPNQSSRNSAIDTADPSWQPLLQELLGMGITEEQIEENADFIKMYIEQKKASGAAEQAQRSRVPPPPPPSAPPAGKLSPQNTGSTSASRRGPPPAPPPARRRGAAPTMRQSSPSPPPAPSPPQPRFKAPPPIADAGKFAHVPPPPARARASSNTAAGPPPPPRPPKSPSDDTTEHSSPTAARSWSRSSAPAARNSNSISATSAPAKNSGSSTIARCNSAAPSASATEQRNSSSSSAVAPVCFSSRSSSATIDEPPAAPAAANSAKQCIFTSASASDSTASSIKRRSSASAATTIDSIGKRSSAAPSPANAPKYGRSTAPANAAEFWRSAGPAPAARRSSIGSCATKAASRRRRKRQPLGRHSRRS